MSLHWLKSSNATDLTETLDVHDLVTPAQIRAGEPVRAILSTEFGERAISKSVRVWRLSPMGIEVILPDEFKGIRNGHSFNVEIVIGTTSSKILALTAAKIFKEQSVELMGLRFYSKEDSKWSGEERRTQNRWATSKEFAPTGIAPNPGKFNDFIFFKVSNFSAEGMQITTSLRNKFLFPGMRLESTVSLPMIGQINLIFEIANCAFKSENGANFLSVGCKFVSLSKRSLESISQYVFQFGPPTSLQELKENGFLTASTGQGIEFRFVRTMKDFEQVLELRKLAYGEAGKLAVDEDVSDEYDARSRIIIGTYQGKVVASVRLIFNEITDQMEHEQFIKFPDNFPRRDEVCEITRVCTHPDFRGADILISLFRFASVTVAQSDRKYILGCATEKLAPLYAKLGFKFTDLKYKHAQLNNLEHTVFIGDIVNGLAGKGVNPIIWNIVWAPVTDYLTTRNILEYDGMAKIRIGFYRLFGPISSLIYYFTKKPRKSKKRSN